MKKKKKRNQSGAILLFQVNTEDGGIGRTASNSSPDWAKTTSSLIKGKKTDTEPQVPPDVLEYHSRALKKKLKGGPHPSGDFLTGGNEMFI